MEGGRVERQGVDQWGVYIGDHCYGTFGALLDASCFAIQLIDRGMTATVTLYSGEVVRDWSSARKAS